MKQIICNFCGDTYPDFDVAHVCSKGPYAPKLKFNMNKQIQELIKKAGTDTSGRWVSVNAAETLVESVIKECCVALSPMLRDMISRGQGVDLIKKHFGVEE